MGWRRNADYDGAKNKTQGIIFAFFSCKYLTPRTKEASGKSQQDPIYRDIQKSSDEIQNLVRVGILCIYMVAARSFEKSSLCLRCRCVCTECIPDNNEVLVLHMPAT